VREPSYQIRQLQELGYFVGDCDDSATLAASLLYALGFRCYIVAVRMPHEEDFSHVFVRCPLVTDGFSGDAFVDIDPIVPMERLPIPNVAEVMQLAL